MTKTIEQREIFWKLFEKILAEKGEPFKIAYIHKIQNEITETITDLKEMTLGIFEFQITDEWIVAFRQIVMLEQYKNPAMASLYKSCFIDLPLQAQKNIFNQLIEKKVLTYEDDIEIMALELYAPFFLYYSVSLSLDDIKPILQRHVDTFFEKYF